MRYLAGLGNPWCLVGGLLVIFLLLIAAALQARSRAQTRATRRLTPKPEPARSRAVTATAPYEALTALRERLIELQRHLAPDSDDSRWLAGYLHDLHNVMDDIYWSLYQSEDAPRVRLLEQLSVEVGRLDRAINEHLATELGAATDRTALHTQLDRLRRALNES